MKQLHFTYEMQIAYSEDVAKCNYTIKCIPYTTQRQSIRDVQIEIAPDFPYSEGIDGFDNRQIYGAIRVPHRHFRYRVSGDACAFMSSCEMCEDESKSMIFRHPHGLNRAGTSILAYAEAMKKIIPSDAAPLQIASRLMRNLHQDFAYVPCSTMVTTTAEEAMQQRKGVCQDYAHILISLLHEWKIAARYVTGFIIGEGQSHAWVEVLDGGYWYGMDPTHDKMIGDTYIRIGVGRDASDCTINRGIIRGGGLHTQTVQVSVQEMERK